MNEPAINPERAASRNACSGWTWRMEPRCESCGYDLRGCPEPRCPECGTAYEPVCPVCDGEGRLDRRRSGASRLLLFSAAMLLPLLAMNLLVPSINGSTNDPLSSALAAVGAVAVFLIFAALIWACSKTDAGECGRCHGTGIDYKDRVWTGYKGSAKS